MVGTNRSLRRGPDGSCSLQPWRIEAQDGPPTNSLFLDGGGAQALASHGRSAASPARLSGSAGGRLPRQTRGSGRRRLPGGAEPLLCLSAALPQPGHPAAVSAGEGRRVDPSLGGCSLSRTPPRGLTTPLCGPTPRYGKRDVPAALFSKLLFTDDSENLPFRSQ